MPTARPFQVFVIVIFAFLAILSVVLITLYRPSKDPAEVAFGNGVVVWGTLPYREVQGVFDGIAKTNKAFQVVQYHDVRAETFSSELVNAIAEGRSPDLILLPHTELVRQRSKLLPIPYETPGLSERDIRDRFIDGADIFARTDGLYAIPVMVDPIILYWNRDLLASAGFATPPATWEQLVGEYTTRLTMRDNNRTIIQSAVAFGEYRNVKNAFGVLSMLLLQAGSKMVTEGSQGYVVALNENIASGRPPLEATIQFYADFANTASPLYSWNRALLEDQLSFIAGDLALYFGHGSEAPFLTSRNPNLNYDIALPPQGAASTIERTYGTFYGFAIPRASRNQTGAFNAAALLARAENATALARALNFAPVERSLIATGGSGSVEAVIYQAALRSRGWLSPDPVAAGNAFASMVEDVVSGRTRVNNAVNDVIDRLLLAY